MKAEKYWQNEIIRQNDIIQNLEEHRAKILHEVDHLDRQLSQEISVLEGLERIAKGSE
jgi:hypothetical protein